MPIPALPIEKSEEAKAAEKEKREEAKEKRAERRENAGVLAAILGVGLVFWSNKMTRESIDLAKTSATAGDVDTAAQLAETKKVADAAKASSDAAIAAVADLKRIADAGGAVSDSAQKNVEAARNALRLEQRAWVVLGGVSPVFLGNPDHWAEILFRNVGRTPPKAFVLRGAPVIWPGPLPKDPFKAGAFGGGFDGGVFDPRTFDIRRPVSETLQVDADLRANIPISDLDWDFEALEAGTKKLYILGFVTYKDVFDEPHRTNFCLVHERQGSEWRRCDGFNDFN